MSIQEEMDQIAMEMNEPTEAASPFHSPGQQPAPAGLTYISPISSFQPLLLLAWFPHKSGSVCRIISLQNHRLLHRLPARLLKCLSALAGLQARSCLPFSDTFGTCSFFLYWCLHIQICEQVIHI
jgi:hypothetical protein